MQEDIPGQIEALKTKGTAQLSAIYRQHFGDKSTPGNQVFLIRQLAYRIQEQAMGGISGPEVSLTYGRKCFFKKACPEPDLR